MLTSDPPFCEARLSSSRRDLCRDSSEERAVPNPSSQRMSRPAARGTATIELLVVFEMRCYFVGNPRECWSDRHIVIDAQKR